MPSPSQDGAGVYLLPICVSLTHSLTAAVKKQLEETGKKKGAKSSNDYHFELNRSKKFGNFNNKALKVIKLKTENKV